jgi:hypothetical protein
LTLSDLTLLINRVFKSKNKSELELKK